MTYRLGHHSTSDDSTAYRSVDEINSWEKDDNPISRFKNYLVQGNIWSPELEEKCHKEARNIVSNEICWVINNFSWTKYDFCCCLSFKVITAFEKAEKIKKAKITDMFEDVYDVPTAQLERQKEELIEHLKIYKDQYPMDTYERL